MKQFSELTPEQKEPYLDLAIGNLAGLYFTQKFDLISAEEDAELIQSCAERIYNFEQSKAKTFDISERHNIVRHSLDYMRRYVKDIENKPHYGCDCGNLMIVASNNFCSNCGCKLNWKS